MTSRMVQTKPSNPSKSSRQVVPAAKDNRCRIIRVIPHQQHDLSYVAFVEFSCRPPGRVLELMRQFGCYRKPPFEGCRSGWYIKMPHLLAREVSEKKMWRELARNLIDVAAVIHDDPDSICCPSRERKQGKMMADPARSPMRVRKLK